MNQMSQEGQNMLLLQRWDGYQSTWAEMRRMGRVAGEESAEEMVTETHDCSAKSWEGLSKRMPGARRGHSETYIVHRYANHLKLVQNSTERKLQIEKSKWTFKKDNDFFKHYAKEFGLYP